MSQSVDQAFVKQFEADVHTAYQRKGTLLRGMVRIKNGITGLSTTFQKVGKGTASTKTRHGLVPVMNIDHTPVECILEDHYAGDFVDKLDELKIMHEERLVTAQAGAWALGRKTDDLIIDNGLSNGTNQVLATLQDDRTIGASTGMNVGKALEAVNKLADRDVPVGDGDLFAALSPKAWTQLLRFDEFADADSVGETQLPFPGLGLVENRRWAGVTWIMHSGLPLAAAIRSTFMWHRTAIGHAIGADVTSDITWEGTRAAHFVNNMMSQGSCLIDDDGVEEILVDET